MNGSRVPTSWISGITDDSRTWETVESTNIGIDYGFFNNRLNGTFDYFWRKNTGMLINITYPDVYGGTAPSTNFGTYKTSGWELAINWNDRINKDWSYNVSFSLSNAKTEVTSYKGKTSINWGVNSIVEGKPLNALYVFQTNGMFQTQADVDDYYAKMNGNVSGSLMSGVKNGTSNELTPGCVRRVDRNGDKDITKDDLYYYGDTDPHYNFGLNLGVTYKNLDFSVFFQGVGQQYNVRNGQMGCAFWSGWTNTNGYFMDNTWYPGDSEGYHAANTGAKFPLISRNGSRNNWNYKHYNDVNVINTWYARCKQMQLGYTLPKSILAKTPLQKVRVWVAGENLFDISNVKDGYDPEAAAKMGTFNGVDVFASSVSFVTTGSYFKNASEFKDAAYNLYSQTPGYTNNYNPTLFDQGTDLSSATNAELSGASGAPISDDHYKNPYKNLRHVNNLLKQAEAYSGGDIDPYVGTAYFYRAYWHFFLLQRFGGVTLALDVPATNSDFVWGPRNSRYEVVSSILTDLNEAQRLLTNTTKESTGNDGSITIEVVSAFKARVCLFEGTWEKYNGRGTQDVTNGDGISAGAGAAMPSDYPSVEQLLTMAKTEAAKFVAGGIYANEYALWMQCEDHDMDAYDRQSYFYLFALEEADSNPYGATKASNDEAIFRKCFDFAQQVYDGANLTHSNPCAGSRKLMDMFLCSDGLPIHKSPLFQGYHGFDDEFKNRDARMAAGFKQPGHYYWCANAEFGQPAKYNMEPADDPDNLNGVCAPVLMVWGGGYSGRKYTQERDRATYQESADIERI